MNGSLLNEARAEHIPDLNLVRVGMRSGLKGMTYSIKAEGPDGGYIAVGSYEPDGQPYDKTRGEIALSPNGHSWHAVSGSGSTFIGTAITDVARGGPGWVAVGFSWGPGSDPVVWTSADASHWQRLAHHPLGTNDEVTTLIHGPGGLLAIATGFDGPAQVWASSNGVTWQHSAGDPFRGAVIQQVTAGGPGYLAVGQQDDDPALWDSSDGLHWQRLADAATFPGDFTRLSGVAARGMSAVAVGQYATAKPGKYGWQSSQLDTSTWNWTEQTSTARPTPVPRSSTIDPKLFRLRQADLPVGFVERDFGGVSDFCDDGNTLCRSVIKAIGSYGDYGTTFASATGGPGAATIQSMAIEGSRSNSHALASLGSKLVGWWNRGGAFKRVTTPTRIGAETRIYRGAPSALSYPPGGNLVAYAVEWQDGKAIGQVYIEQEPNGPAGKVETMALTLARAQWQHLRDARR